MSESPPAHGFIHLHTHSAYSLSEGAIKAEKLASLAYDNAMPAVALTDSANLFGALEFADACAKKGIQPIMGCQFFLSRLAADPDRAEAGRLPPDPIVALAMDAAGLANLQRLSSLSFLRDDPSGRPALSLDLLCKHSAGLFLLTGGTLGPIARLLGDGRRDAAARLLAQLAEAFPDRLAVELNRHGLAVERMIEPGLLALADAAALPIVAANDVYFAEPSMHEAQDALLCIAEGRTMAERDRRRVTPEHWFKPPALMRALFADLWDACDNTLAIARLCAVMAESRAPELPISPKIAPGTTEAGTVRAMAEAGLAARLAAMDPAPDEERAQVYRDRLDYELGVIEAMGFSGYFLIVADFIQWAKAQTPPIPVGPGRGSGAGSVAAWALLITDLDPLRFGLLFERFLNPERVSMPDFDIDFCQDRRDEVIRYVVREYGGDRVAQIITFGKLQAKAAVRDVGRVLGMPYGQVDKIATLIPFNPAKPVTLAQAIEGEPRLQQLRDGDEQVARLLEIALQLEGLYRNASTHAAGVVIGRAPLIDMVPLYRDPRSEMLVTQYSMKYAEAAGLVKFDFLGLKTLTVIERAKGILARQGITLDIDRIPLDDKKTYEMLARGDCWGVFQFEGQGTRDCLRQMRPDRLEDLIAAVALYRPGPMANIPAYCQRKHGEPWAVPHPMIAPVLQETYGIMVYQEQVMQIAQSMGGYSLGAADLLRRAMGKKIPAEMAAQRGIFCDGAIARGVKPEEAAEIFDLMQRFADYGFNKSHAAAYALVSYQTAWLKANHPVAFLAASMSLDLSNTDRLAGHMQEASRAGISVLSPDINLSEADFAVEVEAGDSGAGPSQRIRFGLAAVKRVGEAAMRDLVAARKAGGKFRSIADFARRVEPKLLNKLQIENLARAGAFDSLDNNRARLVAGAETILRRAQAEAEERETGQIALFSASPDVIEPLRLPDQPDWPGLERLAQEAEAVGFHLSAHPLDSYAKALQRLGVVDSTGIEARARAGVARLKLAGTVVNAKERTTRTGSRMAWVRLSDAKGSYEVTCFSEVLARSRDLLVEGTAVLVTAEARMEGEALRLTANEVEGLERAASGVAGGIRLWLDATAAVAPIRALLDREGRGRGRVVLVPMIGVGQEVEVALPGGFRVSPGLMQAMKMLPGVCQVEEI